MSEYVEIQSDYQEPKTEPSEPVAEVPEVVPEVEPSVEGSETPEAEGEPQEEKHPHRSTAQKQRERLEWARQETETARKEAEDLKAKIEAMAAPKPIQSGAPRIEDFDDLETFIAARDKWVAAETERTVQTRIQAAQEAEKAKARAETWQKRDAEFSKSKPDFKEKVEDLVEAASELPEYKKPTMMAVQSALDVTEKSAEIKYYLGEHLDEFDRIVSLDWASAIKELGRIEDKLGQKPEPPKVSKAPAPISPISGAAPTLHKHRSDSYTVITG